MTLAMAATTLFVAAPASAQSDPGFPPEIAPTGTLGNWTLYDDFVARVYGFEGDGYAVIGGDTLDVVCTGSTPPPILPKMLKQTRSGTWEQRLQPGVHTVTAYVYETDLGVFDFFDASCPLYGTDAFPQPFASGDVVIRDRSWRLDTPNFGFEQNAGRYSNGVRGDIFDDDGNRYRLRAWVTYDFDGAGGTDFLAEHFAVQPLGPRR